MNRLVRNDRNRGRQQQPAGYAVTRRAGLRSGPAIVTDRFPSVRSSLR